jgi:crotonobetainyl-CoA:carnitine CoA-transferase CaiB-like acyl-CoA transferase
MSGPLDGLTVVDLTSTQTGAHITQTLADFGCEVVMVEPPGGPRGRSGAGASAVSCST